MCCSIERVCCESVERCVAEIDERVCCGEC